MLPAVEGGAPRERSTSGRTIREERKVVTALAADVVGSTSIAERLDPEDAKDIIDGALARVIRAVEGYGGTVKDLAGDGALALFGAPEAHEDDPERAVRAGLRIVQDIAEYAGTVAERWAVEGFAVRVGIETGLVVLGAVGAGSRVEYGATGDAVNTAARLQAAAAPGSVLVGPATHRLVRPLFEWGEPRTLQLKGKAEPVPAFEVRGPGPARGRPRGLEGVEAPTIVGRDRELEVVRDVADALRAGRGGLLFIVGEPGVGKSRLLAELRDLVLAHPGAAWLEGRCVSYGGTTPYLPFRDLLRGWLGAPLAAADPQVREALRARVAALFGGAAPEVLPYLAAIAGLPAEGDGELARLSPEALQYRIAEAVRSLVERLARSGPLGLAVEDLHWADPTSVGLAERLLPLVPARPVVLVFTQRPERDHPSWRFREDAVERAGGTARAIALDALPRGEDRRLLEELVGPGTLPGELEERLLAGAEGNPFFLEELVRSLVDGGALVRGEGGWRFVQEVPVEVPATVEKVILSRLDRLPAPARDLLDAASVLGRRFGRPLLRAVSGLGGELGPALAHLLRVELLREELPGEEPEYRFTHALIQETAYRTLLRKRRRQLHGRAAAAILSLAGDRVEQHYGVLAHHYREADEPAAALRYYRLAGDAARSVYAVGEALAHYSAALELAAVPAAGADERLAGELRLQRGGVRFRCGDLIGARADLEAALDHARSVGDRATEMRALSELGFLLAGAVDYRDSLEHLDAALELAEGLGDPGAQVEAASRLSIVNTNLLRLDHAHESGRRALELARGLGDERALATAMDALQVASVMIGDMATVDELSPKLAAIHRGRGDLWHLQTALFQWAWVPIAAGRWDEAVARLEEASAVNRRIEDRGNEPMFPAARCWIARARGRYGEALSEGRRAFSLALELGHEEWVAWAGWQLGWTYLELFDVEEAADALAAAEEASRRAAARIEHVPAVCLLALARDLQGREREARGLADRGAQLWSEVTAPPGRAYLQGASGLLALARFHVRRGRPDVAAGLVEPLLVAAEAAGWWEFVASASIVAALAHEALGRAARAEAALRRALEVASRVELPWAGWQAHAALARLRGAEEHREAALAGIAGLSRAIPDEMMRARFTEAATAAAR